MIMMITKLVPQRRKPDVVDLHIDGEFRTAVSYAALSSEQLRAGDVITVEQLERLLAADEHWKAKDAALVLLGVRARARGELAERLRTKGYSDSAIAHAIHEVDRLGFIDDAAFAESWVRDRLRLRPRGSHALVYELVRKRVPADVARAAVVHVMAAEQVNDDELCVAAARRWARTHMPKPGEDGLRRERRLAAYLSRRGYRPGAIRTAVQVTLRENTS